MLTCAAALLALSLLWVLLRGDRPPREPKTRTRWLASLRSQRYAEFAPGERLTAGSFKIMGECVFACQDRSGFRVLMFDGEEYLGDQHVGFTDEPGLPGTDHSDETRELG